MAILLLNAKQKNSTISLAKQKYSMEKTNISSKTLYRLLIYQRCLRRLFENEIETVSSSALAKAAGVKPAQLRKDLAHFGQIGTRGLGYPVEDLMYAIRELLGKTSLQPVILIGAGNLGSALLRYDGFQRGGFQVVGAFDLFPQSVVSQDHETPIYPMDNLATFVQQKKVKLAVLCVPGEHAQEVANTLVMCGIGGILNFSPTVLQVPETVTVNNVDLALELENLSYFVSQES